MTSPSPLRLGAPTHIRLTVTDVPRAQAFWTEVCGFETAVAGPPEDDDGTVAEALQGGVVMAGRGVRIGLRPVDAEHAGDRFDPFRVGLDHLSLAVETHAELQQAAAFFDEVGVPHGPVRTAMAEGPRRPPHFAPLGAGPYDGAGGLRGTARRSSGSPRGRGSAAA